MSLPSLTQFDNQDHHQAEAKDERELRVVGRLMAKVRHDLAHDDADHRARRDAERPWQQEIENA